ncbi:MULTISPECIES: TetR family transcriptional regulator [Brenneria]|uniref:TetR family transcriptional regulator n=1 Tax=Brenneria nigrifluens DSM 30175 = ATCC 13028 TaxID=1121120 RepID=A0A2U1UR31_9GAMM|nr:MULTISPECIES: TetR family transcriptional regulator [Brenneria]EHD22311.1 transcriptional regulator, TetR family [Brenneria sp. EniD312]PWC24135.1 TetR family transcriptional regulator [Brenneria nigrifluens DSM 30175 = ATCC 13028]QCR05327.1 TetR family transcriptional regulator [Brenneria nigrifluens DSM 30175 = ATCC 13028]
MARRTKVAAEKTREQILDAAELCFRDVGVARTTLQMVAARAGCTRGAIYWHFNKKHQLLRQVIERSPMRFIAELETIAYGNVPESVESVRRCLLRSLSDLQGDRHLRNVIEIMLFRGECPTEMRGEFAPGKEGADKLMLWLRHIFESGKLHGEITTPVRAQTLACLVYFVFCGALKNCILMPKNSWTIEEGIIALDILFDIIGADVRIQYE